VPGQADVFFEKRPIEAAVVVDSRNVRRQVSDCFGQPRQVHVAGIIEMLAAYGFAVTDVYVGVATTGRAGGSRYLADSLQTNQRYAAEIVSHPAGHVLEGRLVERAGPHGAQLEEKLVDVLCALQVARLAQQIKDGSRGGVIVVLSEDMDLIPSYEFARELGVTVFAASNDIVDTRAQYSRWILLTEASLILAAGRPFGRDQGSGLRRRVSQLLTVTEFRPLQFKAGQRSKSGVLLQHNSGARAIWLRPEASYQHHKGARHDLYIHGVDWSEGPFPRLVVDKVRPAERCAGLQEGVVLSSPTPTRVSVQLPGGVTKNLSGAAPGSLLPGMTVLVHVEGSGRQQAWRLVGPLEARPQTPGWSDPTLPLVVRAISAASTAGARVRAKILTTGQEVTLQPPSEDRVQTGHEYAAVPSAQVVAGDALHVTAVAVSSRLR
jgi:hypothetical protein